MNHFSQIKKLAMAVRFALPLVAILAGLTFTIGAAQLAAAV
jgi:hypothetical protein